MRKYVALLMALLLVFISTAGCIDIHLAKEWLVPKKEKKMEWEIVEYSVLSHNFTSIISPDISTIIEHYEGNESIPVPELTEHMRIDIDVHMRSSKEIWEEINGTINQSVLPGWLVPIIEALILLLGQRYLEITIKMPDGTEWYHNTTRESMEAEVFIKSPEAGNWIVEVQGDGIGIGTEVIPGLEIKDSFSIDALVRQPKE